ncbi:MAG: NifU family protein [Actinomycetota bacterium]|nr:NifU family protein [Actinomycetota bacterium]
MSDQTPMDDEPILAITEEAIEKIHSFLPAGDGTPEHAVWVEITGAADGSYTHGMSLRPVGNAHASDTVQRIGELAVVVSQGDRDRLRGATVDWVTQGEAAGLTVVNPNKPPAPKREPISLPMSGSAPPASPAVSAQGPRELTGTIDQRVVTLLDDYINPAIAAHGGKAEMVAIAGSTLFLRLSGGCQGCGMAAVTLSQGITTQVKKAIPEIQKVVDITDHASGTNPYYEPAKK